MDRFFRGGLICKDCYGEEREKRPMQPNAENTAPALTVVGIDICKEARARTSSSGREHNIRNMRRK